ncbi:AcaB family transcriptional regulator [Legionella pneumophila]|uniref:AcaB family transcriptional regulator n=1 Tax=Legionella pneumophila TaxID=446 RepID=UPI0026DEB8B2|nr:AcaB family transcriptional regulator [Legionella pneumophila]MDO5215732.1 AcaB family transcriptional regulator [Legionella pneumophila]
MTTFVKLTLSNNEVNRLFTRELKNGVNFYQKLMNKIASLIKCCQEQRVYALLSLYQMNEAVNTTIQKFYDDIDTFEGVLEKKKHLAGKKITYQPVHFPEVRFDSALASSLVELFEVYDHLISLLKTLRTAGCFSNDDDYFNNLRRYFKEVNRLLSALLLSSVKELPSITLDEAIHQKEPYQLHTTHHGEMDYSLLYKALTSNVAPRLEEKLRQPLLSCLNKKIRPDSALYTNQHTEERGVA